MKLRVAVALPKSWLLGSAATPPARSLTLARSGCVQRWRRGQLGDNGDCRLLSLLTRSPPLLARCTTTPRISLPLYRRLLHVLDGAKKPPAPPRIHTNNQQRHDQQTRQTNGETSATNTHAPRYHTNRDRRTHARTRTHFSQPWRKFSTQTICCPHCQSRRETNKEGEAMWSECSGSARRAAVH